MAEYRTIAVDDSGPVARITLNQPDKRNPISPAMCGELVAALHAIRGNVVVLTGAGKVFSAGGDLAGM
jgi:2-(1,2-epoxy-1,2-dihydrophenyl)acetyl-CoA isomerase